MEAGLGSNPKNVKDMDFIEVMNYIKGLDGGKEALEALRKFADFRNSSHSRKVWEATWRIAVANCPDHKMFPDKEFNEIQNKYPKGRW